MPSAYKWKPLLAGAHGHSVNSKTIGWNKNRANLSPLETALECVLDDKTKAEVDREMIAEENEILEQECEAILADWRRYYPNQFDQDGSPLANPPIPIEVDSPPNSPA
ncbi:hypothetical protein B9Z19DRAFT_1136569 [Tuber borchii]|uniref:Uncharacterized protein n=1 Tax=Tuber borchii TaxID=42251 RepID=A0A2T6ZBG0_TUBBO|nr:hypothetical protein B9Z19DRAFT_1136569 [Tuber borchii]